MIITGEKARVLKHSLAIPVILHGSVESSKVFLLATISWKKTRQFGNKDSKGFTVNRLSVTHSKSNENRNWESKSELMIFALIFEETLKAAVVSSDSWQGTFGRILVAVKAKVVKSDSWWECQLWQLIECW